MKNQGTTQGFIREREFLFYQLLLHLCDTTLSGIREYKRITYYSEVDKWMNLYAYQIGIGGSYGHSFKPMKLLDLFFHDRCIVIIGVQGGASSAVYSR